MFSLKKKKTKLASVSSLLFLSFLFSLPFSLEFPKIRAKKPKKKHGGIFVSSRGMLLSHSGGEGGGEGGFTWLMSHSLSSTFLVALLLLSVGHKVTTQDSGSLRVAA